MDKHDIFARNIAFWGNDTQEFLAEKSIYIAGVGALGCIVAEILVRAGIGRLFLVDNGVIDPPDLNRQALYGKHDIGRFKSEVAAERLASMTGHTDLIVRRLTIGECDISQDIKPCDGVADCLDNFAAMFALEDALPETRFMVHGALHGDYGQLTTIVPGKTVSLRKLYRGIAEKNRPVPVVATGVFCIGSLMAQEILKNLRGEPELINEFQVVGLSGFVFDRVPLNP